MAVENPPWALQAGSYSAEQTRRAAFLWAARTAANTPGIIAGGLASASDCQISAAVSGLTVNVSVGEMLIGGNEGGTQGGTYARISSTTNLTIAAASGSKPRIDLVCGTVNDGQYTAPSGGVTSGQWAPIVVTGTPTTGATLSNLNGAPALPGSSLLLGYVLVPTSATSLTSGDILNVAKTVALGADSANFLSLGSPLGYGLQVGTATVAATSGTSGYFFNLNSAWPTQQVLALAMADTSTAGTASVVGVSATNTSQIAVDINSATSQTVFVHWISFGY